MAVRENSLINLQGDRKMKKIIKMTLGMLVFSVSLFADIQFDLHAQHFSKAIEGKYAGARYELTDSYVSTNLAYVDGKYLTQNNAGYVNVELKTAIANWSTSVDAYYIMGNSEKKTRTIKWTSENGESILVSFKYGSVIFDGKSVYTPDEYQRMTISLTQNTDSIELIINGVKAGTATRASFGNLKYVEVQAISEYNNGAIRYDYINSLTIGSK